MNSPFKPAPRVQGTPGPFQVSVDLPNGGQKMVSAYYDSGGNLRYVNPAEVPQQRCRRCDRPVAIWQRYCEGC